MLVLSVEHVYPGAPGRGHGTRSYASFLARRTAKTHHPISCQGRAGLLCWTSPSIAGSEGLVAQTDVTSPAVAVCFGSFPGGGIVPLLLFVFYIHERDRTMKGRDTWLVMIL